jgi:predicted DCC family thiol-disulfide oxidoreductase YuxK
MFEKVKQTAHPPKEKPIMVWDGNCGFCKYWTTRWKRFTQDKIEYIPYQEAHERFPDIDIKHFKKASRLIEKDGSVYSGPRSAYRTFTYGSPWAFLDKWYESYSWFQNISDRLYAKVEQNRSFMFKVTKAMFGSNPQETRPFWAIYLVILLYFIYVWFIK